MSVLYKLESFEGPLDLLLHLIDKAEVDIHDIPISKITDQYLEYMNAMQQFELDIASEFLVMAATLLSIKSKLLLPKPPPMLDMEDDGFGDIDPREELIQKLIEYRKYKGIAEELREKELERSLIYSREPMDLTPYAPAVADNPLKGLHIADLVLAFNRAMRKALVRDPVARVHRDEISVKDRMRDMLQILRHNGGRILFSKLFDYELTRVEIVVTFLSLLELMKVKKITCYQHGLFEDIVIETVTDTREEEEDEAHGFSADEVDY